MNPVIPRSSVFHVISREPTLSIIVPFPRGEGYGGFNELERIDAIFLYPQLLHEKCPRNKSRYHYFCIEINTSEY